MAKKRRINKRKKDTKEKKNISGILWAVFVAIIMVSSTIAFVMNFKPTQTYNYKGINFEYSQKYRKFIARTNHMILKTILTPNQLKNFTLNFTESGMFFIKFNNLTEGDKESISYYLSDLLNLYQIGIFINKTESENCNYLTLIIDKNINKTKTVQNCIYVPLNDQMIKTIDYIIFKYYKIL